MLPFTKRPHRIYSRQNIPGEVHHVRDAETALPKYSERKLSRLRWTIANHCWNRIKHTVEFLSRDWTAPHDFVHFDLLDTRNSLDPVVIVAISYERHVVREQGLYVGAGDDPKETLEALDLGSAGRQFAKQLQAFVRDESLNAVAGERLPGSTEVLESCFGKLKSSEREHSKSGFTGFVLSLCAVLAPTTAEVVHQALQCSRTQEVLNWCHENLGLSVQSKRKCADNPT